MAVLDLVGLHASLLCRWCELGDLLQTLALRLRKDEPGEGRDAQIEQAPKQEGAPAHVLDHVWRCEGEDEVDWRPR